MDELTSLLVRSSRNRYPLRLPGLSHAVLDDVVSECCNVAILADPHDWETAVGKRKVPLNDMRSASYGFSSVTAYRLR